MIRGENQDDAVLCTQDKTYEIKQADTSNAMLLTPRCQVLKDDGTSAKIRAHASFLGRPVYIFYFQIFVWDP